MTVGQILGLAIATVSTMLTILIAMLVNNSRLSDMNGRFSDLNGRFSDLDGRFNDLNGRFNDVYTRIDDLRSHMDARFDEMRETSRAELRRVEERCSMRG